MNLSERLFDAAIPFDERLNQIFTLQMDRNPVYRRFAETFGVRAGQQLSPAQVPLLPIRAFRDRELIVDGEIPKLRFKSSGTGSMKRSTHLIADAGLYRRSIETEFFRHFSFKTHALWCYTPGYSDNPESSLIYMLNELVQSDPTGLSRFLPLNEPISEIQIKECGKPVLLFGAAFGLLDLLDFGSAALPEGSEIVETGGMKTYRRSMEKSELRMRLSEGFNLPFYHIHSEYGMCELLSQSYAIGGEWFESPEWVRISIRNGENPEEICRPGEEGKIGVIDLANVWSCPFILTEDRGVMDDDGRFRVLGRWSENDLRGCNFLIDSEL